MKNLFRTLLPFLILATYHTVTCAQSQGPMLLENPTVSRTKTKIGPVVGTRTVGAGIGATPFQLIDGGSFTIPDWGWYDPQTGTWFIENRGVTPDYELEIMPPVWRAGCDPQLEKAVELALDALKKTKPLPSKRPSYPVYK